MKNYQKISKLGIIKKMTRVVIPKKVSQLPVKF